MKKTRRFYPKASLDDFPGLETWLEEKAQEGWLLDQIGGGLGWRFRREELRKKVTYSVVCYPKASALDPEPSQEQLTFQDFCAHAGWTLAGTMGEIHVFYSQEDAPTPIETEPTLELENIRQTMEKKPWFRRRWSLVADLVLLGLFLAGIQTNPIGIFGDPLWLFVGACYLVAVLFQLTDAVSDRRWYRQAKGRAERGENLPPRGKRTYTRLYACVSVVILAVGAVLFYQAGLIQFVLLTGLGFVALVVVLYQMMASMKREKTPARRTETVTCVAGVVLGLVLLSTIVLVTAADRQRDPAPSLPEEGTYLENLDPAQLPLTLGDLGAGSGGGATNSLTRQGTVLLSTEEICQAGDGYRLEYTVLQVKFPLLTTPCRRQMLRDHPEGAAYCAEDPGPWQAEEAYRLWSQDQPENTYLLFWDGLIVELTTDWALTPQQMETVGQRFSKA